MSYIIIHTEVRLESKTILPLEPIIFGQIFKHFGY